MARRSIPAPPVESSPAMAERLRAALRPALAELLWPIVRPFRKRREVPRDGVPLRPGITALVAARNEAYTIPFCLRSLVGFADQVVCVDNGSEDETLSLMKQFQREHGDAIEVDIVTMPGALLGECQEGGPARARDRKRA